MSSHKHLALFLQDLNGGGAERSIINLAAGLADRGHRVDLLVTRAEGQYLSLVPANVNLVDFNVAQPLGSIWPLIKYLRKEKPRTLMAALNQPNVAALIAKASSRTKTRTIISIRNTLTQEAKHSTNFRNRAMPSVVKAVARFADAVVAVSQGSADDFAQLTGVPIDKIHVIYNPVVNQELLRLSQVRPEHPFYVDPHPPIILAAGRLVRQKDYPTLLNAFAIVRKQRDCRLVILGEGPDRSELLSRASSLGVAEDISFPGFVNPPFGFMGFAQVYAMSSLFEGLPGALIQAMATGASIVSTDCPSGPAEILRNGEYGLLSPVGDVQALAQNLIQALRHPKPAPIESWERFTFENAVNQYEQLLTS